VTASERERDQPTADELRDLAEVAEGLDAARRNRSRNRLIALVVVLMLAAGLWATRDRWLSSVVSDDPYHATPAESFPTGEAGIVLPLATAQPDMTVDQVSAALEHVRQALVASSLDPRMLGGDPAPVLDLLAPDSAKVVRAEFSRGGYGTSMVRLAPGTTTTAPPRVSGSITYSQVDWRGMPALDVRTNYVWAYALSTADGPSGVVVIHSATHWMFPLGHDLLPTSRGMYLGRTTGYWQGMDCSDSMHGLTAPAPKHDQDANPNFSDPDPDAYFDPNRSVRVGAGCR
jgi:hypothetical protein